MSGRFYNIRIANSSKENLSSVTLTDLVESLTIDRASPKISNREKIFGAYSLFWPHYFIGRFTQKSFPVKIEAIVNLHGNFFHGYASKI